MAMIGQEMLEARPGRVDFASRIGARAVTAGVLVALVTLGLLMTLAGGFGLWSVRIFDAEAVDALGTGFYVWAAIAWVLSVFFGGLVAATASRSSHRRDGLLHGAVVWAGACLTLAILSCTWFMAALRVGGATVDAIDAMGRSMALWAVFLADLLALCAAFLGGVLGARSEARTAGLELKAARRPETGGFAPTTPSPQPT